MNKKLVFLALVLVAVLACAIAVADTASYHWENEDVHPVQLMGQKIKVSGEATEVTLTDYALHKEATCTEPAQWRLYYNNTNYYVIGYFKYGYLRDKGHVWASSYNDYPAITKMETVYNDNNHATASYVVTYADGTTQTLRGGTITKMPTCDAAGAAKDFCVYCGVARNDGTTITVPKLNHDYEQVIYAFPTCKKPDDGSLAWKCKNCGNYKKDAAGKVLTEALKLNDATDGLQDGQGKAKWQSAYKAAGYEVSTKDALGNTIPSGHKWDGYAPGETACIQVHHCLICEKSEDKIADPDIVILQSTVINCYQIQEIRVCNRCKGKTSTTLTTTWDENKRHDQHVYTVTAEELFDQSQEVANDCVENHAWHKLDESSAKAYYDKNAHYADPSSRASYKSDAGIVYTSKFTKKQYNSDFNMCITGYAALYECKDCGAWVLKYYGPEGHDFTAWEMRYAPGAGANAEGEWTRYCKKCNSTETYHGTKAPSASYVSEVADTENGFQFKNGAWGVYVNGNLQDGMNTLARYMGGWFVVKNGKWDTSYEGLYTYDGGQFYVSGGQVRNDLQGFVNTKSGFLYFADGMLQKVSTLVQYDGAWFLIIDGQLATGYTGTWDYDGATFNVVGGQVQF